MKIKPFKLLGQILLGAAPVVAGVVAGPGAAAIVAAGMGAAGLTKKAGKKIEAKTGIRPHKVVAPAVAVGLPMALASFLPSEVMEPIRDIACKICDNPMAIVGILTVFWHMMAGNLQKTGGQSLE